jgi:DTW domain-containing protein YfiP
VLILQHPLEVSEAKNTGRLLHLSLPNSQLVVGEAFDEPALPPKTTVLLYPSETSQGHVPASPLPDRGLQDPAALRLVVLDATWRKSRKMLHLNPWLQQLPRLALDAVPDSRYAIRKAHRSGQLSTLEATCLALMQLESDRKLGLPLLAAFDGFVAQLQAYRPST